MTEISVLQSYKMLPSHPSDITEIAAFIDGQALPFSQVLWSVTVDPEQFPEGVQDMRILLHTEEESFLEILSFVNKELPAVSWEDDVAPLNQAKCIECHGGSTQTVLVEKENWKNKINEIIDEVSLGVMPLGGSPLSEEEITTIRAWKQGGFQ